ncbi:MAG: hypothetical protein ACJ71W_05915 [Terriglobales bacterium]
MEDQNLSSAAPVITRTRRRKPQQSQPQAPKVETQQPIAPPPVIPPQPELDDLDDYVDAPDTTPAPVLEFFDLVRSISEAKWNVEKWEIYLYRVEPKVKNTDRPKYICVYHTPVTLEDIKSEHGGGVYKAWLKKNGQAIQTDVFAIDGAPLLQSDQVLVSPARSAAPNPAPAGHSSGSDTADVISRIAEVLDRKKDPIQDALLAAAIKKLTADDKDPLAAQLMQAALANLTGGKKDSVADSFVLALAKRGMDPAPAAAAPADPLGLHALKEILGPEVSLKDILMNGISGGRGGGGESWKSGLVAAGSQLVTQLPQLVQQAGGTIIESKRLDVQLASIQLERERLAAAARGIQVPPPAQLPAAPPPQTPPAATTSAAVDPLDQLATLIVRCAEQGDEGDSVVAVAQRAYPNEFANFAPFLNDVDQVMAFLPSHPILQRLTAIPDYQLFVQQFVGGVQEYLAPEDDAAGEPEETSRAGNAQ